MKIIHTADNHLGAPLTGLSPEAAKQRKEELTQTFLRLLRFAAKERVDALFLCGDLFDTPTPSPTLLRQVTAAIADCPAEIFYVTGNHDDGVVFPKTPSNFHRFDKGLKSYRLGEMTVTGADYAFVDDALLKGFSAAETTCNFLLLHGDVRQSFSVGKGVVDISALAHKNIDYLALGHIHLPSPFKRIDGRGIYRYCGTPEGHGFDECGEKGFVLIDTANGLRQAFIPFACRTYHDVEVNVSGLTSVQAVEEKMRAATLGIEPKDGVKLRLKGNLDRSLLRIEKWQKQWNDYYFQARIEEEISPLIDYARYETQKTLKGELVRLAAQLPEREREKVLSIAFRALSGEDLDV
ncbi:MAG: DNA repair exonuclease [Clostridia bacterium]|nr:DNA repair exonuclease [Clostridia bacterium]